MEATNNKLIFNFAAKNINIPKLDLSTAYVLQYINVPICCRRCINLFAVKNEVLNMTIVDCRKKIFFPTRKQTCIWERSE